MAPASPRTGERVGLLARHTPQSVAVLRALKLGDLLCAVPALRALRRALPNARIVLVGLPWARHFASRFGDYVDEFREFPGYPGLPEREPELARIPEFLAAMQAERFDLAMQLHGSGPYVNSITSLFGATRSAGFYVPGDWCPDPEWFLPWPDRGLEVRRLLALMAHLGAGELAGELEFPVLAEDHRELRSIPEVADLGNRPIVCIHPGASVPERRWPAHSFARVGTGLRDRGFTVVLTGSEEESPLCREVAQGVGAGCLDLAGRTGLGTLGALLIRSRLLVCNDTGVSHVAAALRVPSVVLSTGDNPERWAPTDASRHVVVRQEDPEVTPSAVVALTESLLQSSRAGLGPVATTRTVQEIRP